MSILKKYWPVLAVAVAVWLIWKFVKPTVYDIKVPEKLAISSIFEEAHGEEFHFPDSMFYDSVTISSGLKMSHTLHETEIQWSEPESSPLQWIGRWKNGYRYTQVVVKRKAWSDDTCCSAGGDWLSRVGFYEKEAAGIFKDNYEGSEILLKLEKKKPEKIVALWENFTISGETDGEQIKIQVPKVATKYKTSLIRVWSSDGLIASPVCEIPLHGGQVATRFSQVSSLRPEARLDILKPMIWELTDSIMSNWVIAALTDISQNTELKLVLAFGDLRVEQNKEYTALVMSYFGKKVLVVINNSAIEKQVALPVKGDIKHNYSNNSFSFKGGKLLLPLKAKGFDILW